MDKLVLLMIEIPSIARTRSKEYFYGYTYALFHNNIINSKEIEICRKYYDDLVDVDILPKFIEEINLVAKDTIKTSKENK